ncbi:AP-4 complex accessory subunit tepsin [Strongylocentrotus purpuratus]|uniref:ENTH domain-containing protein n=1 Tax=Strongylocentrotus purpuratus TaxID=7668 RepID=A0A7M7SYE4_STRPU|nr:AP-4 complex accessory subunit tepsin [Strongylocentrotus purpuratus]
MAAPNDFFSGVIGKVAFVNKWPLLLKATQDDDIPTPGYLFKEIADITYESGSNCQCLVDFLVERLEKKSCHIKYKVLKIMLHLVEQGHPSYCEGLRRKAQGIQSSAKCSGPPDPLHGMAPYVAVRKAAKALSERLFDTEVTHSRPSNHAWKQGHMTHGTRQSIEGTTKKMEGFGNTPVVSQKPVTIESLGETVKGGLQQIASKLSGENKTAMTFNQADTGYKPLHGYDPTSNHGLQSPVRQSLMNSGSSQWSPQHSIPTDYSPVMLDDDGDETRRETISKATQASSSSSSSTSSRRWQHPRIDTPHTEGSSMLKEEDNNLIDTSSVSRGRQSNGSKSSDQLSGAGSDLSERLASVSVTDWSEEVSTVESFISDHQEGRPTPTKEELQKFVKKYVYLFDFLSALMCDHYTFGCCVR